VADLLDNQPGRTHVSLGNEPDIVNLSLAGSLPASDPAPATLGRDKTGSRLHDWQLQTQDLLSDWCPDTRVTLAKRWLRNEDRNRLWSVAAGYMLRDPINAAALLDELTKVSIIDHEDRAVTVATLYSSILVLGSDTSYSQLIVLVKPHEVYETDCGVSVLSSVGRSLIGLAPGQTVTWLSQTMCNTHNERRVKVHSIMANSDSARIVHSTPETF
jgi:regulator of nucleoside diphosphate kinase